MNFKISGVDYTNILPRGRYNVAPTPRYIEGSAKGTALDGTLIADLIDIKYDYTITPMPLTGEQLANLQTICSSEFVYCTIDNPFISEPHTAYFKPTLSGVKKAIDNGDGTIYYTGLTLTLKER